MKIKFIDLINKQIEFIDLINMQIKFIDLIRVHWPQLPCLFIWSGKPKTFLPDRDMLMIFRVHKRRKVLKRRRKLCTEEVFCSRQ
jgi:hypothetical protein